ncbi:MAG TPA: hypothetical protein VGQ42_15705 [Candidatus Dormibacteraeota bacterium]|nr:hypothetical protein [Candidatus Dormibacteraeota bacterium]
MTDFVPYKAELVNFWLGEENSEHPDWGRQVILSLHIDGTEADKELRLFAGIRLGKQKGTNTPATLRQILNAFAAAPSDGAITYFDDETFEYGLADGREARLTRGARVQLVGRNVLREDGSTKYDVVQYSPVAPLAAATPAAVGQVTAADVPF